MFAIAGIVATGFGYLYWKSSSKAQLDTATLCPETGSVGDLAILIDMTDPVSLTQLQAARQAIEKRIDEAPVGTRVSLATISPDLQTRVASYRSVCKPPSGAEADMLIENPVLIAAEYDERFSGPVGDALTSLLTSTEAKTSPIMEGLQEFVTKIPGFALSEKPRELVILSDLMQNSETLSFYRGEGWEAFAAAFGPSRLSRNLDGVELSLLRLPVTSDKAEIVDDFWVQYFEAQGVARIGVTTIGDL
ncbi:MAG: hypothetical protein JG765_2621 [Cereibacter sp.]|jgi:hypothetical protein|nr:hypothetical protein [Cereibacter sp.]